MRTHLVGKITVSAAGWVAIGVGVALLLKSGHGVAPYDVFTSGIAHSTGLAVGTASWIAAGIAVACAWALGKRPGWGTLAAAFAVGATINTTVAMIGLNPPEGPASIALAVGGLATLLAGASATIVGRLGAGAIELLTLALAENRHIAGGNLGIAKARWILEAFLTAVGWAAGGAVGVTTVISVLTAGWVISRLVHRFDPWRETPHIQAEGDLTGR